MNPTNIEQYAKDFFKIQNIGVLLKNILNAALGIAALLTLGYLIWGAIDWTTSSGDKTKYEEAKNKITHAIIGLTLTALIWVIWTTTLHFLGIGTGGSLKRTLPLK